MDGSPKLPENVNPMRCMTGYYRSHCMVATCRAPEAAARARLGVIYDRRSQSLCKAAVESRSVVARWSETPAAAGQASAGPGRPLRPTHPQFTNLSFTFVLSTGHAATQYLGRPETWRSVFQDPNGFSPETDGVIVSHERFSHSAGVAQLPLNPNHCEIGLRYAEEYWWPWASAKILGSTSRQHSAASGPLSDLKGNRASSQVPGSESTGPREVDSWFDSGHLASLAIVPAFLSFLGREKVKLVRLRRNRLDLAWSKAHSRSTAPAGTGVEGAGSGSTVAGGPCSSACVWCLCPLDAATLCLPPGSVWGRLSYFQQFLWEADELECQWQSIIASNPKLQTLEVRLNQCTRPRRRRLISCFVI